MDAKETQNAKLEFFNDSHIYKTSIEELEEKDVNSFSNMVSNVFNEFVGINYSKEGNDTFNEYIDPKNVLERLNNSNNLFYVAKLNNEIIGILEIKNNNHISLFFVKKEFHKNGIGKKLIEKYKETIMEITGVNKIIVNSSIYAEKIYSKLGFIRTNEIQEKNGIKYIPMECKL